MANPAPVPDARQRLDKWLFYARAAKSRTIAQKIIETGAVRVNSERTTASDHRISVGDVLTMTVHTRLLVWRILAPGTRRGPASEAATLYEDLSPALAPRSTPDPATVTVAPRLPGAGRPTKKERRQTDAFRDGQT